MPVQSILIKDEGILVSKRLILFFLSSMLPLASTAQLLKIPMSAEHWQTNGNVQFSGNNSISEGVIEVKSGFAQLKGMNFGSGTIEFDIKFTSQSIVGITFRQKEDNADAFYIRPSANCADSGDCVQYMPVFGGEFTWDLFPDFQTKAPIHLDGWNHIRMVVSGRRMNVFVNGALSPTLSVGRLEGDFLLGSIKLHGPASFTHLTIAPNKTDGLRPQPVADPTSSDGRYVRRWNVSTPFTIASRVDPSLKVPVGKDPMYSDLPRDVSSWRPLNAERKGLINLTRKYGSANTGDVITAAWLKTVIDSDRTQEKRVSIGWAREIWVFANGKLVYSGKTLWGIPGASKPPDGSLSLENGAFALPLRKGPNQVVVVLDDNFPDGGAHHFGWGLELRFDDLKGVRLRNGPT